jgi:membrane protease YdiL (CAAX protease family)
MPVQVPRRPCLPFATTLAVAVACGPIGAWIAWLAGLGLRDGGCSARAAVMLLVVAPALEEVVLRAGLHAWLSRQWSNHALGCFSLANVLVALVFAALHAMNQASLPILATAVPALLIGWAWEAGAGRLLVPVLLHAWYNLCLVVASCQ